MPTVAAVASFAPHAVAGTAAIGAAFLVFVALPSELLRATLHANYPRAFAWLAPLRRAWGSRRTGRRSPSSRWLSAAGLFAVGAAFAAIARGGADDLAVFFRVFLAIFAAFGLICGVALLASWAMGRRFGIASTRVALPGFLVLTAVGAVGSHFFGLQPTILFTALFGTLFVRPMRRDEAGKTSAVVCVAMFGTGIVGWIAYSAIGPDSVGYAVELARELSTSLVAGSLGTCVIALLPLTFLDGQNVFRWSKGWWIGLYAVTLVAFLLIVTPLPSAWQEVSDRAIVCGVVFGSFGLISILVWLWFRLSHRSRQEGQSALGR